MSYLKNILIASLILMAQFSFSQNSKFSVEANFPISLGSEFFGDYNGIIDIGAKYRLVNVSDLTLGISVNGSYFKKNSQPYFPSNPNDFQDPYDAAEYTSFTILPRVYAELNIQDLPKIRPFLGLGYGFILFNAAARQPVSSESFTLNGLNANLGFYYLFTKRLFAQLQYDYIKLFDDNAPGTSAANSASIVKFGLGIML